MTTPKIAMSATDEAPAAFQLAEALTILTAGALAPTEVKGAHFVAVPPGYSHTDITKTIEAAQPRPNRKRGSVSLKDLGSFAAYCTDQQADTSAYIYADPDARTITAVFNDQRDLPGWRDHTATFQAEYTAEFARWLGRNGHSKAMTQGEFAEFIEDNLADITAPAAQQLLDVATTIQAKTDITFNSAKRLDNGQNQLQYTEVIDARAGANGALQIPKTFELGMRIFKNGDGYKLTARLKYRLGNGAVKFWYELDRPERSVEDAFAGYITTLREHSGYTVLVGKA